MIYLTATMVQFAKDLSQENWTGVKKISRYLGGNIDFALTCRGWGGDWKPRLTYYVDADGGTNRHHRSVCGYVFTIAGPF
jgi:hypothetical protein